MGRFTRPRYWLLALALLVALGSSWVAKLNAHRPGITRANFDKLKKGMSAEEVDAILGMGGGGMLADGVNLFNLTYERIGPSRPWEWEEIAVETSFDGKGLTKASLRVKKKTVTEWLRGWCAWIGL